MNLLRMSPNFMRAGAALLLVPAVLLLLVSGCRKEKGRDMSTPSARLVGHWRAMQGGVEIYFSGIDPASGKGIMMTDPKRAEVGVISNEYKLVSEKAAGEVMTIMLSDGETMKFEMEIEVSENGLFMFMDKKARAEYRYLDALTKPGGTGE